MRPLKENCANVCGLGAIFVHNSVGNSLRFAGYEKERVQPLKTHAMPKSVEMDSNEKIYGQVLLAKTPPQIVTNSKEHIEKRKKNHNINSFLKRQPHADVL